MARTYYIETMQLDGIWMAHSQAQIRSLVEAKRQADADERTYDCPKRVVDSCTREAVYTVGDTPDRAAERARALWYIAHPEAKPGV